MLHHKLTHDFIPASVLDEVVRFFKAARSGHLHPKVEDRHHLEHAEYRAFVLWNNKKNSYEMYVPKQTVSANSSVQVNEKDLPADCELIMDIHSHGAIPAFFSGVDNEPDQILTRSSGCLSAVVGGLDKVAPQISCSYWDGEGRHLVSPSAIFSDCLIVE